MINPRHCIRANNGDDSDGNNDGGSMHRANAPLLLLPMLLLMLVAPMTVKLRTAADGRRHRRSMIFACFWRGPFHAFFHTNV